MYQVRKVLVASLLIAIGYLLGQANIGSQELTAQQGQVGVPEDTANKIQTASRALNDAQAALESDGMYEGITQSPNAYLILSGGGNAREDLESGRGVDPVTFAALYAGNVVPEIQPLLGKDDQGRVTYNNQVVRIYSKSRLQRVNANRIKLTEVAF